MLVASICLAGAMLAQAPILQHKFEDSTEGWVAMNGASVTVVHEGVKSGKGALAFDYSLDGAPTPVMFPAGGGVLAEMGRLRFWLKADHDAPVVVILPEKKPGGGDYGSLIWARANTWELIELVPSDFVANDGPRDPVDPNHRLDLDQVEGIGLIDLGAVFNKLDAAAPMMVDRTKGPHRMLIDDFEVLRGSAGSRKSIDAFDLGFLQWITLGGMKLSPAGAKENPLDEPAMLAAYQQAGDKFSVLFRRVGMADFKGASKMAFDIASEREATLVISLEVSLPGAEQGPRYQFMIYPPKDKEVFHVNVKLSDFEHDDNSVADPNGKLDPAKIKNVSIADITGLAGGGANLGTNKIWIGKFEAVR